jgi:hypothetical protein
MEGRDGTHEIKQTMLYIYKLQVAFRPSHSDLSCFVGDFFSHQMASDLIV